MAKKQSSSRVSSLAAKVLSGTKKPTQSDVKRLAASVLSQDESSRKKHSRQDEVVTKSGRVIIPSPAKSANTIGSWSKAFKK